MLELLARAGGEREVEDHRVPSGIAPIERD
jgi:hypothetical protein